MKKRMLWVMAGLLVLLAGCSADTQTPPENTPPLVAAAESESGENPTGTPEALYVDTAALEEINMEAELAAIAEAEEAAIPDILEPVASGEQVAENEMARIDYSNTGDGYVMVSFDGYTEKRLKTRVQGPTTTYTYNLSPGEWAVFPLTDGNGDYQIKVYENISGQQYSMVMAAECQVELEDEFAPFLRPNQYVDYSASSKAVEKAWELTRDVPDPLGKVEAIYSYVVTSLTYDVEKAYTVKSGYIPVLDTVLEMKKGICFDYAALMTGMLRSQGIPCKMIFGYAGSAYHAWISVWTEETGWVDGVIFFDGTNWQRLDPTFASSAQQSEEIMGFIGNGSNYTEKYMY